MATRPALRCPRCRTDAEFQVTVEIPEPPVGKIDIAYCAGCACLFEHVRETGTDYDSTTWLPVCRTCRQPVAVVRTEGADLDLEARYRCREHAGEAWHYSRRAERWTRAV